MRIHPIKLSKSEKERIVYAVRLIRYELSLYFKTCFSRTMNFSCAILNEP